MKKLLILLAIMAFTEFAMAQTYTEGSGIIGVDKLGAHQNGGRGCVGCHAPHSGARGNGGNAAAGGAVTDPDTGNEYLWGEDLGPLYGVALTFAGDTAFTLPTAAEAAGSAAKERELTGVVFCLSCHDGNIAKGAMMTNQSYEKARGLLPSTYGANPIPTLLGNDGTSLGNYSNDHPVGPNAKLSALGSTGIQTRLLYSATDCGTTPCLQPNPSKADFIAFYNNYGGFNITGRSTAYPSGGRVNLVLPDTTVGNAYVVCTTCHTPHTMYTYSGSVKGVAVPSGTTRVYPTYFFVSAPYNPGAPVTNPTTASSATQFCRQCHFTGAGGSNEASGILGVTTQF